jgi:transcriptional regulator with XRE-family HTH domain
LFVIVITLRPTGSYIDMPLNALDRKIAMIRIGLSQTQVGLDLHIDQSTVNRVVLGSQRGGPQADVIKHYLAGKLGIPLAELFPESEVTA